MAVMGEKIQLAFIQIQMSSLFPKHNMSHTQLYHVISCNHQNDVIHSLQTPGLLPLDKIIV